MLGASVDFYASTLQRYKQNTIFIAMWLLQYSEPSDQKNECKATRAFVRVRVSGALKLEPLGLCVVTPKE